MITVRTGPCPPGLTTIGRIIWRFGGKPYIVSCPGGTHRWKPATVEADPSGRLWECELCPKRMPTHL